MRLDDVLNLLPENVRGIGEEVLNAMACGQRILSWNDKLQLVVFDESIHGTNIVDLLEYVLYPESKASKQPKGFDQFLHGLKQIGLESQWVRNTSVIEELDQNEIELDNSTDEEDNQSDDGSSDVESNEDEEMEKDEGDEDEETERDASDDEIESHGKDESENDENEADRTDEESDMEAESGENLIEWENL